MSIDFSKITGWSDQYGVVTQITDASGRVLWSATIKFTINGDTYIADRGMTWAEWFASDYNSTGETEGDIKDANGNEVSMDAVIVGGTAYDVEFGPATAIVRLLADTFVDYDYVSAYIDYTTPDGDTGSLSTAGSYELPIGTTIVCDMKYGGKDRVDMTVYFNGEGVAYSDYEIHYNFTLTGNIAIDLWNGAYNGGAIYITEE